MPPLVRFMLANMIPGFLIGLVTGVAFISSSGATEAVLREPLAGAMLLWGFGASFGMGALGTALALVPSD